MKKGKILKLILFIVIVIFSFCECKTSGSSSPTGKLISNSDCLKSTSNGNNLTTSSNDPAYEIISYKYDGNVLKITHQNAAFNCCPGKIGGKTIIESKKILINEKESKSECCCTCLYRLNYEITELIPDNYTLIIFSNYIPNKNHTLICNIDLINNKQGVFKFSRNSYPWI